MSQGSHRLTRLTWAESRRAVLNCSVLGIACLITYWLVTSLLSRIYGISRADDLSGGRWGAIATIFVWRYSYQESVTAAVSRTAA